MAAKKPEHGVAAPAARRPQPESRPGVVRRVPAMLSPLADALCVGGASILVALIVLAFDIRLPPRYTPAMVVTNFLINAPHFLVTYRLLYGSRRRRLEHRGVAVFMPLLLLLYMIFALVVYPQNPMILGAMVGAGAVLLAWHYTGQAWGMMASFGFIQGLGFETLERRLVRANLYVLLSWHVIWAVVMERKLFEPMGAPEGALLLSPAAAASLYHWATVVALASSGFGIAGLARLAWRRRRLPTLRMLLPWVAIHLWYVLLYREPASLFWVQNAHALQYLVFPLRVEMNQTLGEERRARRLRAHLLVYYLVTVGLGLLVMQLIPEGAEIALGLRGVVPLQFAVVSFVNVHHYYIDNVIWKIRNPVVRQELFGHLLPARA